MPGSSKKVSKNDKKFLMLILNCIKTDKYQSEIARSLTKKTGEKWSDSRVFYWISYLRSENFIRESVYSSSKEWELTDRGSKFITECETPNFDLHNLIISFEITNLGNLPEGYVPMKNWKYSKINLGDFEVRVNHGKIPKLKIYPPTTYGNNSIEASVYAGVITENVVDFIERHCKCEIDRKTMKIDRKAHFHPLKDPLMREFGKAGIDYSGSALQTNQSSHAHGDILQDYVCNYEGMIKNFPLMMQHLGTLIMNDNRKWNLLMMIGETLTEMKNLFKKFTGNDSREERAKSKQKTLIGWK